MDATTRTPARAFWAGVLMLLVGFYAVGTLYAVYTPIWQAPDEPAHYNYIREIVETGQLPVIDFADYDQAYLSRLTSEGFPPELSVDSVRYEGHQPPLYYLLAIPVYGASGGSVLVLRLFSLALGVVTVLGAVLATRTLFPGADWLALGVGVFVAFVPQHVAILASVNNDSLAGAVLAVGLWQLFVMMRRGADDPADWARVGVVVALAIATKTTVYLFALAAALGWLLTVWDGRGWRPGWTTRMVLVAAGWLVLPSVAVAGMWWGRNVLTYGWPDFLGLIQHDLVVIGQPRTAAWIELYGLGEVLRRLVTTTFNSFWGQFGWMGVPMPPRYYMALWGFVALVLTGGGLALWAKPRVDADQRRGLAVLVAVTVLAVAAFGYYNLSFVQHQGRYLFPALIPLGVGVMGGLWGWWWLVGQGLQRWWVEGVRWWSPWWVVAGLAWMPVLCGWALFRFIVPSLGG